MNFHPSDFRHLAFKAELDAAWPGISADLGRVGALPTDTGDRVLQALLARGCQAQNAVNITLGRAAAAELPRDWFVSRVEAVAERVLILNGDAWEYRRLLEMCGPLDDGLVRRLVERGRSSEVPEIREAAEEFAEP